jgi:hypothetical protein
MSLPSFTLPALIANGPDGCDERGFMNPARISHLGETH